MPESLAKMRGRARKIYLMLLEEYPSAHCTLDFKNAFQLLAATILAAQCTDERVNIVTPALFTKYPDPQSLAAARETDLQKMIVSTGFFRNKAKSLIGMSKALIEKHAGRVPDDIDALTALPGVGRKTANVILGNVFGRPAVIVDTHMKRLMARLGFTGNDDPGKIESDLVEIVPAEHQTMWSHLVVFHGRTICQAKKPLCPQCRINSLCPFPNKTKDLFG
jgi:endonuclease-3